MEYYPFDKPTMNIFKFICQHPHVQLERLESMWEHSLDHKKEFDYCDEQCYGDYAKSSTDYRMECGLIFSKNEGIYTYFFPSAKGMAYLRYLKIIWIEQHSPYFISFASLVISLIALLCK